MQESKFLTLKRAKKYQIFKSSITLSFVLFFGFTFCMETIFASSYYLTQDTVPASRRGTEPAQTNDTLPAFIPVVDPIEHETDTIPERPRIEIADEQPVPVGRNNDRFKDHSPQKATMLSATLPGLGQAYNRKYWKIPVIYAGFAAVAWFVDFNNTEYQSFRRAYLARVDGNPNTTDDFPWVSTDRLERAMNFYRRNLEITYIAGAALYILNVLDATVDAHLLDFDVGEELSMNLQPVLIPNLMMQDGNRNNSFAGLKFTFRF
ncbi:MAG: hypothetical protein EA393_08320 [Bacteroidetes bacterium]|nr:MAG: hypothetical protein EA393_08320 [Bacteroidota bacterium]